MRVWVGVELYKKLFWKTLQIQEKKSNSGILFIVKLHVQLLGCATLPVAAYTKIAGNFQLDLDSFHLSVWQVSPTLSPNNDS